MNRTAWLKSLFRRVLRVRRDEGPDTNERRAADASLRAFVAAEIDGRTYLDTYPDVRAAGFDPAEHWLDHGLREGRMLAPGITVQRGVTPTHWRRENVRRFNWRGETIAISGPLPAPLSRQIITQARHEPAVLAPGRQAIPYLRWHEAQDLVVRDGVDANALFAAVRDLPGTILIIPTLRAGRAEKYGVDLLRAMLAAGGEPALVIVTDEKPNESERPRIPEVSDVFGDLPVIFWLEVCGGPGDGHPRVLAGFLNSLRPKGIVVIESRLGLDTVARYGRGLSRNTFLCCAYLDMGTNGPGAFLGSRYPRVTLPFALALTDNEPAAESLKRLYDGIPGPGIAVLPSRIQTVPEKVFAARLAERQRRVELAGRRLLWAWIVLGDPLDSIAVLRTVAARRAEDRFEVFGVIQTRGLELPNVISRGDLPDIAHTDLGAHDGIIVASDIEARPDIVLKMTHHAIPMVLLDTSQLRDTFDDSAAVFIQPGHTHAATSTAFANGLEHVAGLTAEDAASTARAARTQVMARHAPPRHAQTVAELFRLS